MMNSPRLNLLGITTAVLVVAAGCQRSDDPIVKVGASDAEMNNAISEARASFTNFLAAFRNTQTNQQYFLLKAKFGAPDRLEHVWIADLTYEGKVFHGVIAN